MMSTADKETHTIPLVSLCGACEMIVGNFPPFDPSCYKDQSSTNCFSTKME